MMDIHGTNTSCSSSQPSSETASTLNKAVFSGANHDSPDWVC